MRLEFMHRHAATDEVIYENCRQRLRFVIGDVRDFASVARAAAEADIVFGAAALKQVPSCEYFPWEACRTNIGGAENLVRAVSEYRLPVETVVGISTDKACKPVNVMGMTKAIQERVYIDGNIRLPGHALHLRPLRQRAGLARLRGPAVPRADRAPVGR